MSPEQLWTIYPKLWHMASEQTWPSIQKHGLLSTTALLDIFCTDSNLRRSIEDVRRDTSIRLPRPGEPDILIRDNLPMSDKALAKCLQDGLTPRQWYRMLNQRNFFWVDYARLEKLLGAKEYRGKPQTILTVDTESLVRAHYKNIELSPINSGSTIRNAAGRGLSTFLPIDKYDFEFWRAKRSSKTAVVELVVQYHVPDIATHVTNIQIWDGNRICG